MDLSVVDVNDNSPRFVFKYPESRWSNGKYYAAAAVDAPISSVLVQVTAEDEDSGPLGTVVYDIVSLFVFFVFDHYVADLSPLRR